MDTLNSMHLLQENGMNWEIAGHVTAQFLEEVKLDL